METSSEGPSAVVAAAATAAAAKAVSKKSRSKRKGKRSKRLARRSARLDKRAARAESKGKTARAARLKAKSGVKKAKKELVDTKKGRLDKKIADKGKKKAERKDKVKAAGKKIKAGAKKAVDKKVSKVKAKVKKVKKTAKKIKRVAAAAVSAGKAEAQAPGMYGGKKGELSRRMVDGHEKATGKGGMDYDNKGTSMHGVHDADTMYRGHAMDNMGKDGTFGGPSKYDNAHMLKNPGHHQAPSMSGKAYDKKKMFSTKGTERLHYLENFLHDSKKKGSSLSKHFGRNRKR